MKKMMTVGLAAVFAAGFAGAQDDMVITGQAPAVDYAQTEVTGEAALMTAYVWRGQVYNNDMVFQPQITASHYGFSVNVWGNYDLGKNVNGVENDFSEIDVSLAYTLPLNLNDVSFDVGVISYNFPGNGSTKLSKSPSTTEVFAKGTLLTLADYVIPSITFFGSVKEAKGTYVLFDLVAPYQISDYLWVEGGVSAGWGNTSYNDYYWGVVFNPADPSSADRDKGFNDFNFEIFENLTASANVTFTALSGGEIRDSAKILYEDDQKLWGGVNIAYDF